jgi:hypothetical protein
MDLVPLKKHSLTPAQFEQLADVPPEEEWLANITNLKTRRAYYRVREGDPFETLQGFANKALLVGHERLFSFASPDANQRNAQVVGQKPDRVQNDPLFAERASQNGMDLIDNEHAHFELSRRDPGALP